MAAQSMRWGRIIVGALIGEFVPVAALIAIVGGYRIGWAPTETDEHIQQFAERAGAFVGPGLGSMMTFLAAIWVCRPLSGRHLLHGFAVGLLVTLMGVSILLAVQVEFHLIFVFSYCLKLMAGATGGWLAAKRAPLGNS